MYVIYLFVINLKPPCEYWKISTQYKKCTGWEIWPIFSTTFSSRILEFRTSGGEWNVVCSTTVLFLILRPHTETETANPPSTTGRVKPRQSCLQYLGYFTTESSREGARERERDMTMTLESCQRAWSVFLTQQISYQGSSQIFRGKIIIYYLTFYNLS